MAEITNTVVNYKAYNVHEGDNLQAQVARIIGIILPRGFLAAGFSDRGDLLMIRYSDYKKDLPEWVPDFFDHRFAEEPLLMRPDQVMALYILPDKFLLVPDQMYDEASASAWIRKIFFIEESEYLEYYNIQEEKARYVYAWPAALKGLVNRYFAHARLLPLPTYQFTQVYKSVTSLQCCVTEDHVSATFHLDRKLQWHQIFPYGNAEEIVYRLKQACEAHGVVSDDIDIFYTLTHSGLNGLIDKISQYLPNIRPTEAGVMITNPDWAATISLFQRLYTCAS